MEIAIVILAAIAMIVAAVHAEASAGERTPAPLTKQRVIDLIYQTAVRRNVDPDLIVAIVEKESSYRADAVNPTDPSYGLGQVQTFWVWHFGYVQKNDNAAAIAWLMVPENNVEIVAQILTYFRGRTNPRTRMAFRFPDEVDIYNVGETLWRSGQRNLSYRDDVTRIFKRLKESR